MIKRKTYKFQHGDILDIEEYHDGRYGAPGLKRMKRRKATKEDMLRVNNEYMFGSNEPINNPIAPTGGKVPGVSKNLEDMTYEEYKDYRQGK